MEADRANPLDDHARARAIADRLPDLNPARLVLPVVSILASLGVLFTAIVLTSQYRACQRVQVVRDSVNVNSVAVHDSISDLAKGEAQLAKVSLASARLAEAQGDPARAGLARTAYRFRLARIADYRRRATALVVIPNTSCARAVFLALRYNPPPPRSLGPINNVKSP